MTQHFDLIVIGAGSGGVRCARVASALGAKVAIIEASRMGGTCVNLGCIPKKLFAYSSEMSSLFDLSNQYGWITESPGFDWPTFRERKDREIKRLNGIYTNVLQQNGVNIFEGFGKFLSPDKIEVNGVELTADKFVIATGGTPRKNSYPGAHHAITSDDVFALDTLPKSILIEGGGYIAVEFASIFNGWGAQVELAYRGPVFLRGFDQDIRDFLADQMREKGISLNFNANLSKIEKQDDQTLTVTFEDGSQSEVEQVLTAIGRDAKIDNLGLENTRVSLNQKGYIEVNEHFCTQEPNIFAIGDVIDRIPLTPVAIKEGAALANYLFGEQPINLNYENIATAIFTRPEVATVGLTEEQAREKFDDVEVFTSEFRPLKYTLGENANRSLMKLIVDEASDVVVGCHMAGEAAAEIMQGIAIAINLQVTKKQLDQVVGIHPTAAEEWVTMR